MFFQTGCLNCSDDLDLTLDHTVTHTDCFRSTDPVKWPCLDEYLEDVADDLARKFVVVRFFCGGG